MPVPRTPRRKPLACAAAGLLLAGLAGLAGQAPAAAAPEPSGTLPERSTAVFRDATASRAAAQQDAATAALDDTYYRDALGKTGQELRRALHTIVSNQRTLSYAQVWDALKATDEDPADPSNVLLLYTGRSQSKQAHGGSTGDWNREHVWPQSRGGFGTAAGPGTDLHHLRPADVAVNAVRGNKDFDLGGGPVAGAPGNLTDADSFEPRDAVKGDVARMVLYMAVRYEGGDGFPDLEANDRVDNGSAPLTGRLSVLRQWHAADPPDAFEKRRNDVIHDDFQQNRNPFVDHPEWVAEVF